MKTPKVVFKKLSPLIFGETDGETIWIDLRKRANPAHTYLHELYHFFHPEWSETEVRKATRWQWKRLTQYERYRLYCKLFNYFFSRCGDEE